jgi:hypothetical protein
MHLYEIRPRKDRRGVDLISDVLPFGRRGCRKTGRITTSKNGALLTAERSLAPLA